MPGRSTASSPKWAGVGTVRGNQWDFTSVTLAGAGVGNRVGNARNVSDNGDNHIHIEEVNHGSSYHPGFPVISGWFQRPINRRTHWRLRGPPLTIE